MPQIINTNVSSLNTQRALNKSQSQLSTSLQRLSSGLRINSAKDDAAGLAISQRMSAQISGLDMARRNANDGVSLSQTAESALSSIGDSLVRMRDLAVQSANATNSDADRAALNQEIIQLQAEIQRVGEQTEFNGRKLLDGSFTNEFFQIGANAAQGVTVNLTDARASGMGQQFTAETVNLQVASSGDLRFQINGVEIDASLTAVTDLTAMKNAINAAYDKTGVKADFLISNGTAQVSQLVLSGPSFTLSSAAVRATDTAASAANPVGVYVENSAAFASSGPLGTVTAAQSAAAAAANTTNGVGSQRLVINGNNTQYIVDVNDRDSLKVVADKINAAAKQTGVTASARTTATLSKLGADGTVTMQLFGKNTDMGVNISAKVTTDDLSELVTAINKEASATGISAVLSDDKRSIRLTNEDGYDIKINDFITTATTGNTISVAGATGASVSLVGAAGGTNSTTIGGKLLMDSQSMFKVTTSVAGNIMGAATTYTDKVSVADVNVNTVLAATRAIKVFDSAINGVNSARADLGALQNRFDAAITNLQTNSENLSAARSRIRDTDFAAETTNMAMATVLQQAGISVLSQANQLPNNVLSLLR